MLDTFYLVPVIIGVLSIFLFHFWRGTTGAPQSQRQSAIQTAIAGLLADRLAEMPQKAVEQSNARPQLLSNVKSPTPKDVLKVKDLLLKTFELPLEIIDMIIDYAQYWPRTSVTTREALSAVGGHENNKEDVFILRSLPLGYYTDADNDQPFLPLDVYSYTAPNPHKIESSKVMEAKDADVMRKWTASSLTRAQHPCRKIVFTISSRDQGYTTSQRDYGVYEDSFTWFDVGLEQLVLLKRSTAHAENPMSARFSEQFQLKSSGDDTGETLDISCDIRSVQPRVVSSSNSSSGYKFDHPFLPPETRLQSNRTAHRKIQQHTITWSADDCVIPSSAEGDSLEEQGRGRASATGDFVRSLKVGDIVTVWARARFLRWTNEVREVKIDVYWAV